MIKDTDILWLNTLSVGPYAVEIRTHLFEINKDRTLQ